MANVIPKTCANLETSLATAISSSAASLTAASITTADGAVLPSGTYGITVDQGTNQQEHMIVSFAGTTAGTIVTRGVSVIDGTTNIPALQFAHARGASIKFTDHPVLIRILRVIQGTDTLDSKLSYTSHPTFSSNTELIDKKYADDLAIAGSPDASTTVKGILEAATDAELQAGTATGSTGALLAATGASFTQTPTANKVPVASSAGKLAAGWGGAASTLATLNGSSKVVEDPANATATPAASKIPIAGSDATLNGWVTDFESSFTAIENLTANDAVAYTADTIAFDAMTQGSAAAASLTISHTFAGQNGILCIMIFNQNIGGITSVKVGGVDATLINSNQLETDKFAYTYYFVGPAVGANSVVITRTTNTNTIYATVISYTGVAQTSPIDASAKVASTAVNETHVSITTTASNTRAVGMAYGDSANNVTLSNNCHTLISGDINGPNYQLRTFDAAFPTAGTYDFRMAQGGAGDGEIILVFNLKPVSAGTAGLVRASTLSPSRAAGFIGFVKTSVSAGQTVAVVTGGLMGGLTVTANSSYFLSATPGALTTTQSTTNDVLVGKAVSATQVIIKPRRVITQTINSGGLSVPSTTYLFPINCGFKPRVTRILFTSFIATTTYNSVLFEVRGTNILGTYVMTSAPVPVALTLGSTITLNAANISIASVSESGFSLSVNSSVTTQSSAISIISED